MVDVDEFLIPFTQPSFRRAAQLAKVPLQLRGGQSQPEWQQQKGSQVVDVLEGRLVGVPQHLLLPVLAQRHDRHVGRGPGQEGLPGVQAGAEGGSGQHHRQAVPAHSDQDQESLSKNKDPFTLCDETMLCCHMTL